MSVSRAAVLSFTFATLLVLPLALLALLALLPLSLPVAIAAVAVVGLILLLLTLVGYWGFLSVRLRFVFPVLFLPAAAVAIIRAAAPSLSAYAPNPIPPAVIGGALCLLLLGAIIPAIAARVHREPAISPAITLAFPLRGGRYCITDGGDSKVSSLINYHYRGSSHEKSGVSRSMRYATDIVKLTDAGCFARGLFPRSVMQYAIFNETLYSPLSGKVVDVVDELPNEIPFTGRHPYNVGNRIAIEHDGVIVLMGHLQAGSIRVKVGDVVEVGQELAQVGNSGLTEFPHVHMQAMKAGGESIWSGDGVPMEFGGVFAVKNMVFRK